MRFSTVEKFGLGALVAFLLLVVVLISLILTGADPVGLLRETAVDLLFETADRIREALFGVE